MDFPGDTITNIRVIDGFSQIHWRLYTEEQGLSSNLPEAQPNGLVVLRHLSRLKELELRLRNLDCLVACLPRRLGLWIFSASPEFQSLGPLCPPGDRPDSTRLQVDTAVLKVSASGTTSSQDLIRNLSAEPPKSQSAPAAARRPDVFNSSSAIYATFVSAVSGAISLQLVRHHAAIPLGSRSLFTAIERDGNQSPRIVNESPTSMPSLTTLHIQLTAVGKLVVSLQTIPQAGLSRLGGPRSALPEVLDCPPGVDLWLAPTGAVARLFGTDPDRSSALSPSVSSVQGASSESISHVSRLRSKCWRASVLNWIESYGLTVDSIDEEIWVEVEVCDSFYARLAGDVARHSAGSLSVLPLKRIPWPARYCFRRANIATDAVLKTSDHVVDPLNLAEEWLLTSTGLSEQAAFKLPPAPQVQSTKADELQHSSEVIDSLSRIAQYPDLQTPGLVYPTPPDGPGAVGFDSTPSDPFNEENGVTQPLKRSIALPRTENVSQGYSETDQHEDVVLSTGVTVGSGMYDANEDEDLFSEIAEKDFGAKGITDADFSFFDEPGFEPLEDVATDAHTQAQRQSTDSAVPTPVDTTQNPLPNEAHDFSQPTTERDDVSHVMGTTQSRTSDAGPSPLSERAFSSSDEDRGRTSSTLGPIEIKKILFPGKVTKAGSSRKFDRRQSHYSPVSFRHNLENWTKKYGADGKFWFSAMGKLSATNRDDSRDDIPIIGLPTRGNKTGSVVVSHATSAKDGAMRLAGAQPRGHPGSVSSTDDSDATGDIDTDSDLFPVAPAILKRKRALSPPDTSPMPGSEHVNEANDQDITTFKTESAIFLGNFLSSLSDWPLTGYFFVSQISDSPILLRREDQVPVAQLLVDQITQSSLDHTLDGSISLSDVESDACSPRTFIDEIFLGQIERLNLASFASLQDNDHTVQITPGPGGPSVRPKEVDSIAKIRLPHLRIRRGKDYFEVLPPAISFWETFGLEPPYGPKDVTAYCIHPAGVTEAADAFLERLGLLYSSCALGRHDRGDSSEAFERGLATWQVNLQGPAGYASTMQSFSSLCEELGPALSKYPTGKESLVVYVINPWTHATALVDICAAFWQLFQKYIAESDAQSEPLNEIALQIVPLSFVASSDSIVVPAQEEYLRLALEVYSRCPATDSKGEPMFSAPPLLLAETLPKTINFRLASDRFSPLQEGKCLHLAYSRSKDQRWISAAWTDNVGLFQRTASYCLRFRGSVASRPAAEARNEIWETTRSILEKVQVRWRLLIAITDFVDQEEVDAWTALVDHFNRARHLGLELTIINVNPTPDLHLEAPSLLVPPAILNSQVASPPATTPNLTASAFSPDPIGSAPTPTSWGNVPASALTPTEVSFDAESEALLVDITDESWAVILSHRLNISPHLTEYRPALVSGYLLRRKSASDGDGAYSMSVNLVYSQRSAPAQEALLREILVMYRDLATLARSRGMSITERNTLPWHIATAVRAQEILTYTI